MAPEERLTLQDMQREANEYAGEAFSTTPMHLPASDPAAFKRSADAILSALVQAWAAGFARGRETS